MDQQIGSQQSDRYNKPKSSTKQLQLHVASVYSQIAQLIKQKGDLQIQMPTQVPTAVERVNLIKSVLSYLLEHPRESSNKYGNFQKQSANQCAQNDIQCINCQNYQKNLQKLQNQIRNHIRTHQQLKLYQDGLQQKIEQHKKQKKQYDKKYQSLKKKYQQYKITMTNNTDRVVKIEQQNQRLRNQLKHIKQSNTINTNNKIQETRKTLNRYESNKQNLSQWKNTNFINQRQKQRQRTSIEKRPESTERMRVSVNVRSTKGIPISSKIVQEKTKQEKAKALKSRLGF